MLTLKKGGAVVNKVLAVVASLLFVVSLFVVSGAYAGGMEYIGANKCKGCHIKQYKSWEKTAMAESFESLKPGVKADAKKKAGLDPAKDYTADAQCLKCHTTGYGKPGGFTSIADTPNLTGVQCESCHGPGSEFRDVMRKNKNYTLSEIKAAGLIVPSEDETHCLACHSKDSPFNETVDAKYKFVFKERLKMSHEHYPLKHKH